MSQAACTDLPLLSAHGSGRFLISSIIRHLLRDIQNNRSSLVRTSELQGRTIQIFRETGENATTVARASFQSASMAQQLFDAMAVCGISLKNSSTQGLIASRACHERDVRARCNARLTGFLIRSQLCEGPERYPRSRRFDIMPSSPVLHALLKADSPSPFQGSTSRIPLALRINFPNACLRFSRGAGRKSTPFSSRMSDAKRKASLMFTKCVEPRPGP